MEAQIGNRPLWIALGVSLVLHLAFVLFVKLEFRPLPNDPIVLNMRLVKPVGPLPSEEVTPSEPASSIAAPADPVFEDVDPVIDSALNFENMLFPEDFLTDFDMQIEEPQSMEAETGTSTNPITHMSVQDMVQSIADIAAANSQDEDKNEFAGLRAMGPHPLKRPST